jgi:hypothetical protein
MLQSKFGTDVRKYLYFPEEAATREMGSRYSIYKWEIETLILLLLSGPKQVIQHGPNKILDCRQFGAIGLAVDLLRSLENSESAARIDSSNVLLEMHRIGQRQFEWQRGFANAERLYRFAYIYGQGKCGAYFEDTYGMTIEKFMEISFVLFAQLHTQPWSKPQILREIGIELELVEKVLALNSRSLIEMRTAVASLTERGSGKKCLSTAYLPSSLRQFPIIRDLSRNTLIAPLPDLILFRATSGLYYDIKTGPQHLFTEANNRFEQYACEVIKGYNPRFNPLRSQQYGPKKAKLDTPDIMLQDNGEVVAVIECKATKLTYEAQFAENPIEEAEGAYTQIVKGVAQLWRFLSHVRRGVYEERKIAANARCIILTMEPWMQSSSELQAEVFNRAKLSLSDEPDISEADMRPVIFCPIQNFIDVMSISTEEELLATFDNATLPQYAGWGIREIRRVTTERTLAKPFPLEIHGMLPWWKRYEEEEQIENKN